MAEHSRKERDARLYLAVPFDERGEVKRLGARWDQVARRWYVPERVAPSRFARWLESARESDPVATFSNALRDAGLLLRDLPLMDGRLHRVPVQGDRPGAKSGAYVGYLDARPAGFIQNFKTGEKRNWKAVALPMSAADRARLAQRIKAARDKRNHECQRIHAETCRLLNTFLSGLPLAGRDHPYLQKKGVDAHGLLFNPTGPLAILGGAPSPQEWSGKGALILPIRDGDGRLISAQSIDAQGRKTFPRGGRLSGGYHLIGDPRQAGLVVIAEGYATAATIHELTNLAVAVAFHAGNLEKVARGFRDADLDMTIIIAGDNDHRRARERLPNGRHQPNTGREAAEKAALAVGGIALLPCFAASDTSTDWNDLAAKGNQAFFEQWEAGMELAGKRLKLEQSAWRRQSR